MFIKLQHGLLQKGTPLGANTRGSVLVQSYDLNWDGNERRACRLFIENKLHIDPLVAIHCQSNFHFPGI